MVDRIAETEVWFDDNDILRRFLATLEPWEAEEVACVHYFFFRRYDLLFKEVVKDPSKYQGIHRWMDNIKNNAKDDFKEGNLRLCR